MTVFRSQFISFLLVLVLAEARRAIWAPLLIICAIALLGIPVAAARGKLHMPGYAGLALLAMVVGWLLGRIGTHFVRGSGMATVLSASFFILIAVAIGSVLALASYKQRPEPEAAPESKSQSSSQ